MGNNIDKIKGVVSVSDPVAWDGKIPGQELNMLEFVLEN